MVLSTATWPLLEGAPSRDSILPLVTAVADQLWSDRDKLDSTLGNGLSGLALLLGYLSFQPGQEQRISQAEKCLELAIGRLNGSLGPRLFEGYLGTAWAIEHLQRMVFKELDGDQNLYVDEILLDMLKHEIWPGHFDLISGLTGIGVYALERLPRITGRIILERVIYHLEAMSSNCDKGLVWMTQPQYLPDWQRDEFPKGYINLGTAHGIPAVLGVLAGAVAFNVDTDRSKNLLYGGIKWLVSQFWDPPKGSYLPDRLDPFLHKQEARFTRIAWCYGDLGASLALLQAARLTDDMELELVARSLASLAADIPISKSGIKDASICHGSAGNAHLFHRLYTATGDHHYREASLAYLTHVLENGNLIPNEGFPGFQCFQAKTDKLVGQNPSKQQIQEHPGLLTGACGAALSLLAFLEGPEPAWDRHLLVSLPRPQGDAQ